MREPDEMGWYAELGADGEPRAVNGVKKLMPEDAVEITEDQAKAISASVRARAQQASLASPNVPPETSEAVLLVLETQKTQTEKSADLEARVSEIETIMRGLSDAVHKDEVNTGGGE